MAPSSSGVLSAVRSSGVRYQLHTGWDNPSICGWVTPSVWKPSGVLLHHTSNMGNPGDAPSLGWVLSPGELAPVRGCHFLVGRSGLVHVIYSQGCYHAGGGGPLAIPGLVVPVDRGNAYFYGIEIESEGTQAYTNAGPGDPDGFTAAQVVAVSHLTASLVRLLGRNENSVFRHRDWAPTRKDDVLQPLSFWRTQVHNVLSPSSTTIFTMSASAVAASARINGAWATGSILTAVKLIQKSLNEEKVSTSVLTVDGFFGPMTRSVYAAWQRKCYVTASGIPDYASLYKLGTRHGFKVVP